MSCHTAPIMLQCVEQRKGGGGLTFLLDVNHEMDVTPQYTVHERALYFNSTFLTPDQKKVLSPLLHLLFNEPPTILFRFVCNPVSSAFACPQKNSIVSGDFMLFIFSPKSKGFIFLKFFFCVIKH